ncbi:MAG: hypothetical protein EOP54_11185 [Sphingobacteriales bacterium]|nr:MAG: hypothetical protein EOP54_11185 [Sphingobacteriales bacterium]
MKKKFVFSCFGLALLTSATLNAQQFNNTVLAGKAGPFTIEVEGACWTPPQAYIQENAQLLSRVEIKTQPFIATEGFSLLSTTILRNKCDAFMQRDEANFNPDTFNPLKYFLNFTPGTSTTYRVDNTNYIIIVHP